MILNTLITNLLYLVKKIFFQKKMLFIPQK